MKNQNTQNEAQAILSTTLCSPVRTRRVADLIRGKSLDFATRSLLLEKVKPAKVIFKLLKSAISNAQQKGTLDLERLYIKEILINEGPRIKRWMPRAHGRADQRLTRTSHIVLRLAENTKKTSAKAAPKAAKAKKTSSKKAGE